MAKNRKPIDLEALSRAGGRALGRLGWMDPDDLPPAYQRPEVFAMVLKGLAADLPSHLASSKQFQAAQTAVARWSAGAALQQKAVELYWDPEVRAIAGNNEQVMAHYWAHPDEAMRVLAKHIAEFPQSRGVLNEVMLAIGEYQNFDTDHDSGGLAQSTMEQQPSRLESHPAAARSPSTAGAPGRPGKQPAREPTTYAELVKAPNLSPSEWAKLNELAANM
jgi:hypothetical protein